MPGVQRIVIPFIGCFAAFLMAKWQTNAPVVPQIVDSLKNAFVVLVVLVLVEAIAMMLKKFRQRSN